MNKEFLEWFVPERAKALALILLTRRDDLVVREAKDQSGLDYTVYVQTGDQVGNRPFGLHMAATMRSVTLEEANKQLQTVMQNLQSLGPFPFPVCVFYFTVKDGQGYYAWAYEPLVGTQGEPKLSARSRANCHKLSNETLEQIVSLVKAWYEKLYKAITSPGNIEPAVNPEFAALADEFEARVRDADISGTTEVTLVYRCVDQQGHELQAIRTSIVPQTKVSGFGATGPAFAAAIHRDTILGNINSLVRHAPIGLVMLRDAPQLPLRIVGFDLEIKDIPAQPKGRHLKAHQA